jgi:3-dehydroquinate synthase
MRKKTFHFSSGSTDCWWDGSLDKLTKLADPARAVVLTDEHVYAAHARKFRNWNTIVLSAGEAFKVQATVDAVVQQLIALKADRQTTLVGVGGGVITDLTGYIASVYMRGLRFGFVPTTVLSLVDASLGGKNGIDVGPYKNMVGTIRQPAFILHDLSLLRSLPAAEWENGFAEIIKHACILDARLFAELEINSLRHYRRDPQLLSRLVQRNVTLKSRVVQLDEQEKDLRRLLNFGHTLGHALETQYELLHGQAIAIGMTYAAELSHRLLGFRDQHRVVKLLEKYKLPTYAAFDTKRVMDILRMDKKRVGGELHYILLKKTGKGVSHRLTLDELNTFLQSC